MQTDDIVIIGSGIACTSTLIEVFTRLIENAPDHKLSITVIEKHHEFWKGVPYGSRSSINALTITSITDFFTSEKERALFFEWLYLNMDVLDTHYKLNGGLTAGAWFNANSAAIEVGEWSKVYIPRFIFGKYQHLRFQKLLSIVEEKNLALLNIINAEAIDVQYNEDGTYEITFEKPDEAAAKIRARKLVIATGSAPSGKIESSPITNEKLLYINDLYDPGTDLNIEKIKQTLIATDNPEERNLLLIGSNASSLEFLYLLAGHPDISAMINKIIVLSKSGSLPNHISNDKSIEEPLKNLNELKSNGNFNITTLIEAAKKDIIAATVNGIVVTPRIDKIIGCTIELLHQLDDDSQSAFFGIYGMQLSNLFRRAGGDYKGGAETWHNSKQLNLVKGAVLNLELNSGFGILKYSDPVDNKEKQYPLPIKIAINCTGSNNLDQSPSRLLYNLVHNKICRMNLSGKGFLVNDKFEAAPNLYVIGPLLGGNRNKRIYFWHLENASRLMYLAPYLAEELVAV